MKEVCKFLYSTQTFFVDFTVTCQLYKLKTQYVVYTLTKAKTDQSNR